MLRTDQVSRRSPWLVSFLATLTALLVLSRFYRFRPFLDEPHAFRQAWTAFTALEFYRSGMNILRPSVIALGDIRHVLIEFPLPEWLVAAAYQATGPTLYIDRLFSVGCFAGSAWCFFQIAAVLRDRQFAWISLVFYLAAPLGIYFSRAIHIDSAALLCGQALAYAFLKYGETGRGRYLAAAGVASVLGMLIKAPYVFFLILPALYMMAMTRSYRRALVSVCVFGAATAIGLAWYFYAQSVNAQAPDLSFIRGYQSTANRLDFYAGGASARLSAEGWRTIGSRIVDEITAGWWWALAVVGLVLTLQWPKLAAWTALWTAGAMVFVLLFFPVNVMHDYYQLPLIAPIALLAAVPVHVLLSRDGAFAGLARAAGAVILVAVAFTGVRYAIRHYYRIDREGISVGEFVHAHTTDRDLVIMALNDAYYLDPRYLYYSDRRGWSIQAGNLDPRAIDGLRPFGATVVVTSDWMPPSAETMRYLGRLPVEGVLEVEDGHVSVRRLR